MLSMTHDATKTTNSRLSTALTPAHAPIQGPRVPADTAHPAAEPKALSGGACPISTLPTEIFALVAGYLAPEHFFAMTHVCRAWHHLLDHKQVIRSVAEHRVLGPPPLYADERYQAIASGDLAEDVRLEGALITRLRQGPVVVGDSASYQSFKFSPTYRYALKRDYHAQETTLHRVCGRGLVRLPLRFWPDEHVVSFAPVGDALLVHHRGQGTIEWLELSGNSIIPRTIVPQAPFTMGRPLWADHGHYLLFACSDGRIRAAREQAGRWTVTVQENLNAHNTTPLTLSHDTKTVALREDRGTRIAMYHRYNDNAWLRLGAVRAMWCTEAKISPRGHIAHLSSCDGDEYLGLNPNADEAHPRLWELSNRAEVVSEDESHFAQFHPRTLEIYRWPDGSCVDTIFRRGERSQSWVTPFIDWRKRHRELDVNDGRIMGETSFGTVTLRLFTEPETACGSERGHAPC